MEFSTVPVGVGADAENYHVSVNCGASVIKTRLISILMGAKMQLLEVVTGHSQFLSHFPVWNESVIFSSWKF